MSYTIFVRFRKTRLALARRIDTIETAFQTLDTLRRERMHDANDVFVVDDGTGAVVDKPASGAPT